MNYFMIIFVVNSNSRILSSFLFGRTPKQNLLFKCFSLFVRVNNLVMIQNDLNKSDVIERQILAEGVLICFFN